MYKIIGADQNEYGPISAEQVKQWVKEGRANGQTQVLFEGSTEWKPLASFAEFADALTGSNQPVRATSGAAPQPFSPQPAGPMVAATGTNPLALTGFILGLLSITIGIFCCGPLFSIPALICSGIALSQINKNPERQKGKGFAIAGLVLGSLGVLVWLLMFFIGVMAGISGKPFKPF